MVQIVMELDVRDQSENAKTKHQTVASLLHELSDRTPAPGGGSAVAVSGAYGTGLLLMACRYSNNGEDDLFDEVIHTLQNESQRLLELAERDRQTYQKYRAALEDTSDDRNNDTELLLIECTRIPLEIGSSCETIFRAYRDIREKLKRSFQTDIQAGLKLVEVTWETAEELASYNIQQLPEGEEQIELEQSLEEKRTIIRNLLTD